MPAIRRRGTMFQFQRWNSLAFYSSHSFAGGKSLREWFQFQRWNSLAFYCLAIFFRGSRLVQVSIPEVEFVSFLLERPSHRQRQRQRFVSIPEVEFVSFLPSFQGPAFQAAPRADLRVVPKIGLQNVLRLSRSGSLPRHGSAFRAASRRSREVPRKIVSTSPLDSRNAFNYTLSWGSCQENF